MQMIHVSKPLDGSIGRLSQDRFRIILAARNSYVLEVCRYVDLARVRASMCWRPHDCHWRNYLARIGQVDMPVWLGVQSLYEQRGFGRGTSRTATKSPTFVAQCKGGQLWNGDLKQQIYLGDEEFITRLQKHAGIEHINFPGKRDWRNFNVSKISKSELPLDSDVVRCVNKGWETRCGECRTWQASSNKADLDDGCSAGVWRVELRRQTCGDAL